MWRSTCGPIASLHAGKIGEFKPELVLYGRLALAELGCCSAVVTLRMLLVVSGVLRPECC
jgi:hypothetical protein